MIRIFLSIVFSFLLVNCSFNENSRIWNNKNKELDNNKKTKNTKIILDKKKETPKEFNSTLKLNLSKKKFPPGIQNEKIFVKAS